MATTTRTGKSKSNARSRQRTTPLPRAGLNAAGEWEWECPQCRTRHHESKRACGCEYVRPAMRKLIDAAGGMRWEDIDAGTAVGAQRSPFDDSAHGVPETQAAAAAKEASADDGQPIRVPREQLEALLATYSGDLILDKGQIRKPVQIDGRLWVMVGGVCTGRDGYSEIAFYEAVPRDDYAGRPVEHTTARKETDRRREERDGQYFYDRILARCGKTDYVLQGPERITSGRGVGAVVPNTTGKQRRRQAPRGKEETAKGGAAEPIETVALAFPGTTLDVTIDLQQQGRVWAWRKNQWHTGWLANGRDAAPDGCGLTETLAPHRSPAPATRDGALSLALTELRESLAAIGKQHLTPLGREQRGRALRLLKAQSGRLLGPRPQPRETLPADAAPAAEPTTHAGGDDMVQVVATDLVDWRTDNPRTDFQPEPLQALAASIDKQGLLEPILLRRCTNGRFEGWAGERRFRAVTQELGRTEILARVFPPLTSDQMMIRRRADENLERADLNPIERAEALRQKLIAYGWSPDGADGPSMRSLAPELQISQGELSNALRLLKLPQKWQRRVISGDISVAGARALATWADRPAVLAEVEQRLRSYPGRAPAGWSEWHWRSVVTRAVEAVTRPCTPGTYYALPRKRGMESGRVAFTKRQIEQHAEELDLVTIDGEQRAFNVARWDELHAPLKEAKEKRAAKRAGTPAGGDDAGAAGARSPEEERRRRAEQRKQLETKVWRYKVGWLQERIVARVAGTAEDVADHAGGVEVVRLLIYFAGCGWAHGHAERLAAVCAGAGWSDGFDRWGLLAGLPPDCPDWDELARRYVAALLEQDPFDRHSSLEAADVPAIAGELGIDLDAEWRVEEAFLQLCTKDQLAGLAREWKLTEVVREYSAGKRGELIAVLIEADEHERLPPPKILRKAKG